MKKLGYFFKRSYCWYAYTIKNECEDFVAFCLGFYAFSNQSLALTNSS